MTEREQIRRVCQWNRDLAQENRELRRALGENQETIASVGVEHDAAVIFLDAAWDAAQEGQRP